MLFGDTHVETPLRKSVHHEFQGASCRHGRCNPDDSRIFLCQFNQRESEYILKFRRHTLAVRWKHIARSRIEFARGVIAYLIFFRLFQSFAFGCNNVQELWAGFGLQAGQGCGERTNIMAVNGPGIIKIQCLKNIVLILYSFFDIGEILL